MAAVLLEPGECLTPCALLDLKKVHAEKSLKQNLLILRWRNRLINLFDGCRVQGVA